MDLVHNRSPCTISKSIIKPSSPTPDHLRRYNLSLMDQVTPHLYMPIVLFYSKVGSESSWNVDRISSRLKKSLSETLTQYYPFSGRLINGNDFIDCNDEGLDYYEARMDCRLDDVVKQPEPSLIDSFSPPGSLFNVSFKASPLIVQITYFSCGGIAISAAILHKLGDGCTVSAFLKDWVAVACGRSASPTFISSLVSPFKGSSNISTLPGIKLENANISTKRFSFESSKIAELKAIVEDSGVHNPTRVQVVSALIYKCAMAAAKEKSGPSTLSQMVNLRPMIIPPLPENSVGNLFWFSSIMSKDESDKSLHTIVDSMKKQNVEFREKYAKDIDECYSLLCESIQQSAKFMQGNNSNIGMYRFSSLCRYSYAEMDFGWGKPVFVGILSGQRKNTFFLLDSLKPGGIDALVVLDEQEMALFENDGMLLQYATINGPDSKL